MRKSIALGVLSGILFLMNPSQGMAEGASKSAPFKSRDRMLKTLMKSGVEDIFEFPGGETQAAVVSLEVDGQQNLVLKRSSVKSVVSTGKNWKRIESMDYSDGGVMALNLGGYHVGSHLFEAYKISNFAICHKLRDSQVATGAGQFTMCMIFPRPVDEVLSVLENRGVIEE